MHPNLNGSRRGVSALLALLVAAAGGSGCSSADPGTRWSRHFDGSVWGGAAHVQIARPDRLLPEAALAAMIPLGFVYDKDIQERVGDRTVDSRTKTASTVLQFAAPAVPLALGVYHWAEGDEGRHFEVAVESLVTVVSLQQLLALSVHRERPDHDNHFSFPSGHTGWIFAATTLVVRQVHDPSDTSFHPLDTLLYAPAIFTGWERIVRNRHWTSDVAAGAFLGVVVTNLVWDAHFRTDEEDRRVILFEDRPRKTAWMPGVDVIEGQFVLTLQARF